MPHLGAAIPYIQGRLDMDTGATPRVKRTFPSSSEYFKEFFYDTVSYDARPLRYALETIGPDRVVFGTDYPFMS